MTAFYIFCREFRACSQRTGDGPATQKSWRSTGRGCWLCYLRAPCSIATQETPDMSLAIAWLSATQLRLAPGRSQTSSNRCALGFHKASRISSPQWSCPAALSGFSKLTKSPHWRRQRTLRRPFCDCRTYPEDQSRHCSCARLKLGLRDAASPSRLQWDSLQLVWLSKRAFLVCLTRYLQLLRQAKH